MLPDNLQNIKEIPVEIVDSVIRSVESTFESISGSKPDIVSQPESNSPLNGMIGNIAVFNPVHTLSMMIIIPKNTAISLSRIFCGMELPFESDDMGDLVGEIANILAGEVAAGVEQVGFVGQSSLPTATRGSDLKLFLPNKPPTAKLHFTCNSGEFSVSLALCESKRFN